MESIEEFLIKHWNSVHMIYQRQVINMLDISHLIQYEGQKIAGLLTYYYKKNECHIVSLNSEKPGSGIGSMLLKQLECEATLNHISKIWVETTNDNYSAIKFYQKMGFDMYKLLRNELEFQRQLKPAIPLVSAEGIPIRHILVFQKNISI